tara:strand:- start:142 stop:369 length:228 start_codon:yes stop_codon:yes gene_type:complete
VDAIGYEFNKSISANHEANCGATHPQKHLTITEGFESVVCCRERAVKMSDERGIAKAPNNANQCGKRKNCLPESD